MAEVPYWLTDLAVKKLGEGATVVNDYGEWIAERTTAAGTVRVAGQTKTILVWFLEHMPELTGQEHSPDA